MREQRPGTPGHVRTLMLGAALKGLVATSLLASAGFWAAVVGSGAVATYLHTIVLLLALFTLVSFCAAGAVHLGHTVMAFGSDP